MGRAALAILLAALAPGGCDKPEVVERRFDVPLTAAAPPEDEVIATVDGRAIRASDVAVQARARGVTAKVALDELITAEVLAGEAQRRGLDRDRDAREAARAEAVRRYLQTRFEREVTPSAIPDRMLNRAYNANRSMFDHSEYVDVWHILTPVKKGASAADKAAARAVAEELAQRARGVASVEAFKALKDTVQPPGEPLKIEQVVTARDGWVLTTFSFPAFDQLKKPGDTSSVIETDYGYHVLYLVRRIPPVHESLADVTPRLRGLVFPEFQKVEFKRFLEEEVRKHAIVKHEERIPVENP
jgi:peptidyl-prolyl cis-trans isomerase C